MTDVLRVVLQALGAGDVDALSESAVAALAHRLAPYLASPSEALDEAAWLDTSSAATYLGMSVQALHKLTNAHTVPFHQEGPRCKMWFRRAELDEWRRSRGRHHAIRAA